VFVLSRGYEYPQQYVRVAPFPADPTDFPKLFETPPGLVEQDWPPHQLAYLGVYLNELECRTIVLETHYIDRDYIEDLSLFYGRSLRSYPNYCQRMHFFSETFSDEQWRAMVVCPPGEMQQARERLQSTYLGFTVVRPLPAAPVGRTILKTYGKTAPGGLTRDFGAIRKYQVHLGGFSLNIEGLAFQQQDRGVSACATTALWSALQRVTWMEGLPLASPASITESASRYLLAEGRALPSEGLTLHQIGEATRAAGLAPLVIKSTSPEFDRAQLLGYISSGFAPVLAIRVLKNSEGHAICGVGLKTGPVLPQTEAQFFYREAASAVQGVYVHDDRLGPYAVAAIFAHTITLDGGKNIVRTGLHLKWPDEVDAEVSVLDAIIVPLPTKVRLTITRMRSLGLGVANTVGKLLPQFGQQTTLRCRYRLATDYRAAARDFGLTPAGLYNLNCELVLSRYIGMIELSAPDGAIVDFLLDATESGINPVVLGCVQRRSLSAEDSANLAFIASRLGTCFLQ
jgi:hypothetical protein